MTRDNAYLEWVDPEDASWQNPDALSALKARLPSIADREIVAHPVFCCCPRRPCRAHLAAWRRAEFKEEA